MLMWIGSPCPSHWCHFLLKYSIWFGLVALKPHAHAQPLKDGTEILVHTCSQNVFLYQYDYALIQWSPPRSSCNLTVYPHPHSLVIQIMFDKYQEKRPQCAVDQYRWICREQLFCSSLYYSASPGISGTKLDFGNTPLPVTSSFLRLFYCGDLSGSIKVVLRSANTPIDQRGGGASVTLIHVVVPTLAVCAFFVLVAVFVLCAMKRGSRNDGGRGFSLSRVRLQGRRHGTRSLDPPPPSYNEMHKYPLSERFRAQLSSQEEPEENETNSIASGPLSRITDTPPPSYSAALWTVSRGVTLTDRLSVHPNPDLQDRRKMDGTLNLGYVPDSEVARTSAILDEAAYEPFMESVTPVTEPALESVTPVTEPAMESVTPVTEPAMESVTPVTEPAMESVTPVTEPAMESVTPVTEPALESVTPVTEPSMESVTPVTEPALESVTPVTQPPSSESPSQNTPTPSIDADYLSDNSIGTYNSFRLVVKAAKQARAARRPSDRYRPEPTSSHFNQPETRLGGSDA